MTVVGKAKLNQEAKFTRLAFWESLEGNVGCCVTLPGNHQARITPSESADSLPFSHSLVDLAL